MHTNISTTQNVITKSRYKIIEFLRSNPGVVTFNESFVQYKREGEGGEYIFISNPIDPDTGKDFNLKYIVRNDETEAYYNKYYHSEFKYEDPECLNKLTLNFNRFFNRYNKCKIALDQMQKFFQEQGFSKTSTNLIEGDIKNGNIIFTDKDLGVEYQLFDDSIHVRSIGSKTVHQSISLYVEGVKKLAEFKERFGQKMKDRNEIIQLRTNLINEFLTSQDTLQLEEVKENDIIIGFKSPFGFKYDFNEYFDSAYEYKEYFNRQKIKLAFDVINFSPCAKGAKEIFKFLKDEKKLEYTKAHQESFFKDKHERYTFTKNGYIEIIFFLDDANEKLDWKRDKYTINFNYKDGLEKFKEQINKIDFIKNNIKDIDNYANKKAAESSLRSMINDGKKEFGLRNHFILSDINNALQNTSDRKIISFVIENRSNNTIRYIFVLNKLKYLSTKIPTNINNNTPIDYLETLSRYFETLKIDLPYDKKFDENEVNEQIKEFLSKKAKTPEEVKTEMSAYLISEGFNQPLTDKDPIAFHHNDYGKIEIKKSQHNDTLSFNLIEHDGINDHIEIDCHTFIKIKNSFLHESEEDLNKLKSEIEYRKSLFKKRTDFLTTLTNQTDPFTLTKNESADGIEFTFKDVLYNLSYKLPNDTFFYVDGTQEKFRRQLSIIKLEKDLKKLFNDDANIVFSANLPNDHDWHKISLTFEDTILNEKYKIVFTNSDTLAVSIYDQSNFEIKSFERIADLHSDLDIRYTFEFEELKDYIEKRPERIKKKERMIELLNNLDVNRTLTKDGEKFCSNKINQGGKESCFIFIAGSEGIALKTSTINNELKTFYYYDDESALDSLTNSINDYNKKIKFTNESLTFLLDTNNKMNFTKRSLKYNIKIFNREVVIEKEKFKDLWSNDFFDFEIDDHDLTIKVYEFLDHDQEKNNVFSLSKIAMNTEVIQSIEQLNEIKQKYEKYSKIKDEMVFFLNSKLNNGLSHPDSDVDKDKIFTIVGSGVQYKIEHQSILCTEIPYKRFYFNDDKALKELTYSVEENIKNPKQNILLDDEDSNDLKTIVTKTKQLLEYQGYKATNDEVNGLKKREYRLLNLADKQEVTLQLGDGECIYKDANGKIEISSGSTKVKTLDNLRKYLDMHLEFYNKHKKDMPDLLRQNGYKLKLKNTNQNPSDLSTADKEKVYEIIKDLNGFESIKVNEKIYNFNGTSSDDLTNDLHIEKKQESSNDTDKTKWGAAKIAKTALLCAGLAALVACVLTAVFLELTALQPFFLSVTVSSFILSAVLNYIDNKNQDKNNTGNAIS